MSTPGQEIKKLERWAAGWAWAAVCLAIAFLLAFAAAIYIRSDQLDTRRFNNKLLDTLIEQDNLIIRQSRELRFRPTVVVYRKAK